MPATGRLELEFVDVVNRPIRDTVDIRVRHQTLPHTLAVTGHDASTPVAIGPLHTEPQGLYKLEVMAQAYWPIARFVTIPATGVGRERITLPIRPDRARAIHPSYDTLDDRVRGILERSQHVKGHDGLQGAALYQALSDQAKAGLLNIARKSLTVPFSNGSDLLQHVTILDVRDDRCFVEVPVGVKEQVTSMTDADLFHAVNGSLHEPPPTFAAAGSFKTPDAFGNLQMTFFTAAERCVADIDIDDAAGLGHVFQVIRNHLTGKPTHPYNIHQILVKHQHLHPGYELVPA